MSVVPPYDLHAVVNGVMARAPEWLRRDLSSTDPRSRRQAEEALSAMVVAAIEGGEG